MGPSNPALVLRDGETVAGTAGDKLLWLGACPMRRGGSQQAGQPELRVDDRGRESFALEKDFHGESTSNLAAGRHILTSQSHPVLLTETEVLRLSLACENAICLIT